MPNRLEQIEERFARNSWDATILESDFDYLMRYAKVAKAVIEVWRGWVPPRHRENETEWQRIVEEP